MPMRRNLPRNLFRSGARWALCALALVFAAPGLLAEPRAGVSVGGKVKYPAGFSHYDYADPGAVKGGRLTMSRVISFDKLNSFSLKGRAAPQLGRLYDSLGDQSLDEPFSIYGKLAETIDIAPDALSVTFTLRPKARFSDGAPVTAADVVFSFNILRSKAALPFYRFFYRDVTSVRALNRRKVQFRFSRKNRELALILAQLDILPRHFYGKGDFGRDFNTRALGSGPYRIKSFDMGKFILYERNKNYWGRDLNVNKGRNNFDEILVKIYGDPTVQQEGLKSGDFDFLWVANSKSWATVFKGKQWDRGWISKVHLKHQNTAGMQGFVFNQRKPIFRNRGVRKALALALDFEWSNKNLFYGQYDPMDSYFDNSELGATGLPSARELKLLEPLRGQLPPEVFTAPMGTGAPQRTIRQRLRQAKRLLEKNGWKVKNGKLVETATGTPMAFTVLLVQPGFERITEPFINNLKRLGVNAAMKTIDSSVYELRLRNFDFDVVVWGYGQSASPGNEQMDYWHSRSAGQPGSRNLMGLKNPAVDRLVDAVITAGTRKELVTATRALDRALWFGNYLAPHWFIGSHRVTFWNKLRRPARLPVYYNPWSVLDFWWIDRDWESALQAAVSAGRPLPQVR